MQQDFIPLQWTIGKVKVLWKSGSKDDCSNYSPLTLLSIPSEITVSVICNLSSLGRRTSQEPVGV